MANSGQILMIIGFWMNPDSGLSLSIYPIRLINRKTKFCGPYPENTRPEDVWDMVRNKKKSRKGKNG